jgi:hypothetical protein
LSVRSTPQTRVGKASAMLRTFGKHYTGTYV